MENNELIVPPDGSQPPIIGGVINPEILPEPKSLIEPLRPSTSGIIGEGMSMPNTDDVFSSINQVLADQNNFQRDLAPYTKIGTYDADYTGLNFDRYYNTPRVYSKLGFSPFRDNERIYNNNMTWWDGFKRASGQSLVQASVSFKGALPWNAWDGEYSDIEGAKRVERSSAIGMDTRGGFGAWANNTMMNFGFTYGILTEIAAEELALFGLSFVPGMQGLAAGRTASNMRRLLMNLGPVGRGINVTADFVKNAREIQNMRGVWNAVKAAKLPRVFTPNLFDATRDIYKGVRKGEALYSLANGSKAFGAFYRDTREIAAALSESKLEAGMVENNMKNKLTDKFYAENGRMPNFDESNNINNHAEMAGKETFLWNMPVIYMSNKLVFDKAFRGFTPMRVLRSELQKGFSGKLVFNEMWRKSGGDPLKLVADTMKERAKNLLKPKTWKPKNLAKDMAAGLFVYSKANVAEGLQEIYQEAVSPAMERYYMDKYNNPHVWSTKSQWGLYLEESKKLLSSKEGLEIFGSGFVMGGLIQVPQKMMFQYIPEKFMAITDKEGWKEYKKQRDKNSENLVNAMNYIIKANPDKYFDPVKDNASAQVNLDNDANMANENGDRLSFHDVLDDAIGEHIYTVLQSGKIDLLKTYIDDMRGLSSKEMEDAFGPVDASQGDPGSYYSRQITKFQDRLEEMEKHYEYVQENSVNPFDYKMIGDDEPLLKQEIQRNQIAMERYKKLAVLSHFHYGRTVQRMASIYNRWLSSKQMRNMNSTDLSVLFAISPKFAMEEGKAMISGAGSLVNEITRLKREIKAMKGMESPTPESKKDLQRNERQLSLLEKYYEVVNVQYLPLLKKYKQAQFEGNEQEAEIVEEALSGAISRMQKVYTDYLLFVAEKSGIDPADLTYKTVTGERVLNQELDDAFHELKDFYTLSVDRADLVQAVNALHNPDVMMLSVRTNARIVDLEMQQFESKMKEWWEKFENYTDANTLIAELSRIGVFFDPALMSEVDAGRLDNVIFYYHNEGKFLQLNQLQEPKYTQVTNQINEMLDKYAMVKNLSGRPLFEYRPEGFTYGMRPKMKADQRTLANLAAEYNFNPQASETEVSAKDALQKIIDSQYSTPQERILAKRLMGIIPDLMKIKFKTGQKVSGSYSETTGIVVDPRYASFDYKIGTEVIEVVIMQQIAKAILSNEMAKDSAFKTKVGEMLQAARNYQAANRTTFSPMVGLKDEVEFVGSALANAAFQTMLGQIEYQPTGKTLWEEFMDAVREFLSKILKAPKDGSLLEEAMYVITSKLGGEGAITEQPGGAPSAAETGQPPAASTGKRNPLSWVSPINDLRPIWSQLLDAYKSEERQRERDNYSALTVGWDTMTDIDLLNSPGFRTFLETKSALDIINEYNEANGLVPKSTKQGPKSTTMEQKDQLKDLGYSPEQIAKFDFISAADIIARGERATTQSDRDAALAEIERQLIKKIVDEFYNTYNAIDPQAEGAREQLFQWLSDVKQKDRYEDYLANGINSQLWERMFEEKLAQLPRIDRLEINKIYKVNGVLYKVMGSKDEVYSLVRFDELGLEEQDRSEPLELKRTDLNAMNIISSDMVEKPTEVDKTTADTIERNTEGLTPEQVEEANKLANSKDDIDFNPCGE